MSFVTRCTSCGTLFKVVADQLKISDGWVRCGQCATVFDAQANLIDATPAVQKPQQPDPASAAPVSSTDSQSTPEPDSQRDDSGDIVSEIQSFRESRLQDAALGAFAYAPTSPASFSLPNDEPLSIVSRSEEPTTFFPASKLDSELPHEPLSELSDAAPLSTTTGTPDFVKQAQRVQRWRSPWVRLGLGLVCLLFLITLAAQIAWHEKDRIAAQWPQAKPWLDQFCQLAGCQVQPYQRIEAIAVDASSFNRINKNNTQLEAITQSYRLSVTLKNVGQFAVALPHVELSLQDTQDTTVLRRVLSPSDLGASLQFLAPAQDVASSLTLQIDAAQLAGSKIHGYRVLAFYP